MINEKTLTDLMYEVKSYKMLAPGYRQRMKYSLETLQPEENDTILEVGCGSGENTEIITRKGAEVTAMEVSKDEIVDARKRVGDKANFILCDAQHMPFRSKSFHKVLCLSVLEHIPEDSKAVSEIKKVMDESGFGVIGVPSENAPFFRDPVNFVLRKLGMKQLGFLGGRAWGHERHYTEESLKNLLKVSGLKITRFERTEHSIVSMFHFYLPEIYTFLIRPTLKSFGGNHSGKKNRTYGSMYRTLSRLSEFISAKDRKLSGSNGGFCVKVEK